MSLRTIIKRLPLEQLQGQLRDSRNKRLRSAALIMVVLAAVNIAVYGMAVSPAAARLEERERALRDVKKRHADAVLYQKQKASFAGIKAGIPTQKDMPLLVKDFAQTARGLHLAVSSLNYDIPKREGGGLTMLAFSFPAEGGYSDIKRFIYELETTDRLVGIQDLKLEGDKGRVKLQMKLVTYIRGE